MKQYFGILKLFLVLIFCTNLAGCLTGDKGNPLIKLSEPINQLKDNVLLLPYVDVDDANKLEVYLISRTKSGGYSGDLGKSNGGKQHIDFIHLKDDFYVIQSRLGEDGNGHLSYLLMERHSDGLSIYSGYGAKESFNSDRKLGELARGLNKNNTNKISTTDELKTFFLYVANNLAKPYIKRKSYLSFDPDSKQELEQYAVRAADLLPSNAGTQENSSTENAPIQEEVVKKQPTGRWAFSDDSSLSSQRKYISLVASQSTGRLQTTLRMSCTENGMGIEVYWGASLKNLYPNESVPTATRVLAKFGDSATWDMAWQPLSNSTVTREPRVQLNVSSTIDSAIFSLLGMESISKKNTEMFDWTPEQFFNRMANHEHSSKEPILRLNAKTAANQNLVAIFDLTGINEIAKQQFSGVCVR